MIMFNGIFFIFILLHVQVESYTFGESNFTNEWYLNTKGSRFPPLVTNVKDQLVYVSFPQLEVPIMKLESTTMNKRPCEISLEIQTSTLFTSKSIIKRSIGATALINEKVIVSLIEAGKNNEKEEDIKLYIVDRRTCSFDIANLNIQISNDSLSRSISVVAYVDTFDVFLSDVRYCAIGKICRLTFDENGKLINSRATALLVESKHWRIDSILENDSSSGFIYKASTNDPQSTRQTKKYTLKKLDSNLNVLYEKNWNEPSLLSTSQGRVSVCKTVSGTELTCSFLDSQLKDSVTARIDSSSYKHKLRTLHLHNVPTGGAILLSVQSQIKMKGQFKMRPTFPSYVQYIDANGNVGKPIKFHHDIWKNYEIDSFRIANGLCITTSILDRVGTKCIAPENQKLLTFF